MGVDFLTWNLDGATIESRLLCSTLGDRNLPLDMGKILYSSLKSWQKLQKTFTFHTFSKFLRVCLHLCLFFSVFGCFLGFCLCLKDWLGSLIWIIFKPVWNLNPIVIQPFSILQTKSCFRMISDFSVYLLSSEMFWNKKRPKFAVRLPLLSNIIEQGAAAPVFETRSVLYLVEKNSYEGKQ